MNTPEEDRLFQLSQTVEQLLRRQTELESRVRELEGVQNTARPPLPPRPSPPPIPPQLVFRPPVPPPPSLPVAPLPLPASPPLETRVGLNWLNRTAVLTLLIGVAFLFKYGVDTGSIGPAARVALGVAAGLGALLAGERLVRKNQRVFAQGITGLGLSLLYLAFYAAASLYHIVEPGAAFGLMAATTVLAGWLSLKYNAQAIAILGMVGGYLTPIALSSGADLPWVLFTYLFLLNAGGLYVAHERPWGLVEPLAFLMTFAMYAGWAVSHSGSDHRPVATIFAIAFYVQFALGRFALVWGAVQLLAPLAIAFYWDRPPRFLPFTLLLAAAGLVVGEYRKTPKSAVWTAFCFWLLPWVWIAVDGQKDAPESTAALLTAAFLLFFGWSAGWLFWGKREAGAAELGLLVGSPAAYFTLFYILLNPAYHDWMGLFAALLGGVYLALAKLFWKTSDREQDSYPAIVAAGVALAFVTLAIPIQFLGFRISMAWALEGVGVAWLRERFRPKGSDIALGILFALVLCRIFGADLWMYGSSAQFQPIVNARFFTFLVATTCLWMCAWIIRRGWEAGIAYVTGHVLMLFNLSLETVGIIERSWPQADQASTITVALSILMAVYAVLLVSGGVVVHAAIHRILGLILAGVVILKLYLLDVWMLSRGFRIVAFLGLGALLLALSYLYSRFRDSLQKLWKNEGAS